MKGGGIKAMCFQSLESIEALGRLESDLGYMRCDREGRSKSYSQDFDGCDSGDGG